MPSAKPRLAGEAARQLLQRRQRVEVRVVRGLEGERAAGAGKGARENGPACDGGGDAAAADAPPSTLKSRASVEAKSSPVNVPVPWMAPPSTAGVPAPE